MNWMPLTSRQPTTCSLCGTRGNAIGAMGASDNRLCRECLKDRAMRELQEAGEILEWLEANPPTLEWSTRS